LEAGGQHGASQAPLRRVGGGAARRCGQRHVGGWRPRPPACGPGEAAPPGSRRLNPALRGAASTLGVDTVTVYTYLCVHVFSSVKPYLLLSTIRIPIYVESPVDNASGSFRTSRIRTPSASRFLFLLLSLTIYA
jgi:hypothetical protein